MADSMKRGAWAVLSPLLSAVLALIGYSFLTGRSAGAIETRVTTLERQVERMERESETIRAYMQSIDQRLARIEGKLDRK